MFCETQVMGRYRIIVIDLPTHPQLVKGDQILAIPNVLRRFPHPTINHPQSCRLRSRARWPRSATSRLTEINTLKTKSRRRQAQISDKFPTARTKDNYILHLFDAEATARSQQAIVRIRELCETELKGRCALEVSDIYQPPALARENQIATTPKPSKSFPRPVRRLTGNFTEPNGFFGEFAPLILGQTAP